MSFHDIIHRKHYKQFCYHLHAIYVKQSCVRGITLEVFYADSNVLKEIFYYKNYSPTELYTSISDL